MKYGTHPLSPLFALACLIMGGLLVFTPVSHAQGPKRAQINKLANAQSHLLGTPYKLGAGPRKPSQYRAHKKPRRIDSSSYVWYVYWRAFGVNIDPINAVPERAGAYTDTIWRSASADQSMAKTLSKGRQTFRIPNRAGGTVGDIVLVNDPRNDAAGGAIIDHVVIMGKDGQVFQASGTFKNTTSMSWDSYKKDYLDKWGYKVWGTVRVSALWNQ